MFKNVAVRVYTNRVIVLMQEVIIVWPLHRCSWTLKLTPPAPVIPPYNIFTLLQYLLITARFERSKKNT